MKIEIVQINGQRKRRSNVVYVNYLKPNLVVQYLDKENKIRTIEWLDVKSFKIKE